MTRLAFRRFVATLPLLLASMSSVADPLSIDIADGIESVLAKHRGQRVTLQTVAGAEFTGTVRDVNTHLVVLGNLVGKDYMDAAIAIDAITSIVVRTR